MLKDESDGLVHRTGPRVRDLKKMGMEKLGCPGVLRCTTFLASSAIRLQRTPDKLWEDLTVGILCCGHCISAGWAGA